MLNIQRLFLMSQVTTLGIGGPAKEFVVVKTEEELIETIQSAKKDGKDFLVIGGGSNLLISDEGVDKLVIKNGVTGIERSNHVILGRSEATTPESGKEDSGHGSTSLTTSARMTRMGGMVTVKAGTQLQELVDFTISNGLSGLQKMTGIPGTLGGAIYGNAGAYGQTISDHLVSVKVIDSANVHLPGEVSDVTPDSHLGGGPTLTKDQCEFGYRDSGFKKNELIILEAQFKLEPADPQDLKKEAEEILSKRLLRYPPGLKCPGSFFKNILAETLPKEILEKIPEDKIPFGKVNAGYLLEQVGAKGQREGDIEVSQIHANLFINLGGGKAEDFYKLASRLANAVKQKFGISLEPEVQLINLPPIT